MRLKLLQSENMLIQKIETPDTDLAWRTVRLEASFSLAYAITDSIGGDGSCGMFAVFDGHGGKSVSDYLSERMPEVSVYSRNVTRKLRKK